MVDPVLSKETLYIEPGIGNFGGKSDYDPPCMTCILTQIFIKTATLVLRMANSFCKSRETAYMHFIDTVIVLIGNTQIQHVHPRSPPKKVFGSKYLYSKCDQCLHSRIVLNGTTVDHNGCTIGIIACTRSKINASTCIWHEYEYLSLSICVFLSYQLHLQECQHDQQEHGQRFHHHACEGSQPSSWKGKNLEQ